jgi:hypothetical protein
MLGFVLENDALFLAPILLYPLGMHLLQQGAEQGDKGLLLGWRQLVPMPSQAALRHRLIRKPLRQHLLNFCPTLRRLIRAVQGRIRKNGDQSVESLAHLLHGRTGFCEGHRAAQKQGTENGPSPRASPTCLHTHSFITRERVPNGDTEISIAWGIICPPPPSSLPPQPDRWRQGSVRSD